MAELQGNISGSSTLTASLSAGTIESVTAINQLDSIYNFPNRGSATALYIDASKNKAYRWNENDSKYYCVGSDYSDIKIIDAGGE